VNDRLAESAAALVERLRPWLAAKIAQAAQLRITEVVEPAQGFSNKTVLFRASWLDDGMPRERGLVLRVQRESGCCPLLADIFHQYRVMQAAAGEALVPPLFLAETDPALLGAPFFLMDRIEGRVPPDFPSHHQKGWYAETLNPAQRERAWWNAIAEMERLHRIDWRWFPFLARGATEAPGSRFYLEHFIGAWYEWAAQGRSFPQIEQALRFLLDHVPAEERSGLVWNDARMGNTMFGPDLSVVALFDFEVATLGPPEIDLGWWLYAEDIFSTQFGIPRIAGVPDRAAAIRGFERIYGRAMPEFDYYEAIAALKHAVIAIRNYSNGKIIDAPEALPNFAMDRLRQYLERHAG
jgi:aminoglycoside phosphotransferase (APT) family kinase protein